MIIKLFTNTIKIAFKITLLLLVAAIIIPTSWFIWRMYQPMDRPEFHGVTHVQYMAWRKAVTQDSINRYNAAHPTYKYTGWGDQISVCGDTFGEITSTLLGMYMTNTAYKLSPDELAKTNKAWKSDLPKIDSLWDVSKVSRVFWDSFEYLQWSLALSSPEGDTYCRVRVPTAADFEAMKNSGQLASTATK